ncbi:MAG TPA: CUAEP/CCAEP-tail radical SAM protein [Anaeromyxobacteraceae bacterium]|nr:CUAEP/CCAEP-tail radical SAM protein [Anaeromyxobacteraceae bacterium]
MRGPGEILLVSTYELGHAPHGIAVPKAFLRRAGFAPAAMDLAVESLEADRVCRARLVAISVPMHTALRLGLAAAERIRALNPGVVLCFHGPYALLHGPLLLRAGASAVLGGECEEELVELARSAEQGLDLRRFARPGAGSASLSRLDFPVPDREGLPPPDRYARLVDSSGHERLAGYLEASRGCLHLCRHCPLPPLYRGRFFAVPADVVLEDVRRQASAGATHVTFGDPDFLNGPGHALRLGREIHRRFPGMTFDFTAKVEHLVRLPEAVAELASLGALFVTSAVESLSDEVLGRLAKGHTRADVFRAFEVCARAGLALRASLLPFTPWSTLDDYLDLLDVFESQGWLAGLDPVQLTIRLLVPPGSLLCDEPSLGLEDLDEEGLTFRWSHPDPRMDGLQSRVAAAVAAGVARGEPPSELVAKVRALALAAAGREHAHVARPFSSARAPRLTESWFC